MPSRRTSSLAAERAAHGTALVILDMISRWDFDDADKLLPQAAAIAPRIAALKRRCRREGIPAIYANDNHGRWRSDFRHVYDDALAQGEGGAQIARELEPDDDDYFVLKPKHSAFYGTPLQLLLQHLKVRRLLVCGVAGDQCVLATASDARMRDYEVLVPRDCIASQTARRNRQAADHFASVLKLPTTPSSRLRLRNEAQ
jgi:nicotinamidase-related amidase